MKIKFLAFVLLTNFVYSQLPQLTNADLLKNTYPNYKNIFAMPYIKLNPTPIITDDIYIKSLSEIVDNKNKYTFKNNLKKEVLLTRIITVLKTTSEFTTVTVKDDGSSNFVITAQLVSDFISPLGGYAYERRSVSNIKIRIKDFTYQIEILDFKVGKRDWQDSTDKSIIRDNNKEYDSEAIGVIFKKDAQQNWNSTFADYSEKFVKLNENITETNDF